MTYAFFYVLQVYVQFLKNKIRVLFCYIKNTGHVRLTTIALFSSYVCVVRLYAPLLYIYEQNVVILGLNCKYCTNV